MRGRSPALDADGRLRSIRSGVSARCHWGSVHSALMNGDSEKRTRFRLLIVADHGVVREALAALFREAGEAEPAAAGAQEAVWAIEHFCPRVVLLDAAMADADPFATARIIVDRFPGVRLVFLDDTFRPAQIRSALSVGASGYCTKRASLDQLAE